MTDGWNEHRLEVLSKIDKLTDAVGSSEKRHLEIAGLVEALSADFRAHMEREEAVNSRREELLSRAVAAFEKGWTVHEETRKLRADLDSLEARVGQLEARDGPGY